MSLPGDLSRICDVVWTKASTHIVLEVAEEDSKVMQDAPRCSIQQLLNEIEDTGVTDVTINSHEVRAPTAGEGAYFFNRLFDDLSARRPCLGALIHVICSQAQPPMPSSPRPTRCTSPSTPSGRASNVQTWLQRSLWMSLGQEFTNHCHPIVLSPSWDQRPAVSSRTENLMNFLKIVDAGSKDNMS